MGKTCPTRISRLPAAAFASIGFKLANGHYAFLWLTTRDAAPQKIVIKAANPAGVATDPYELKARKQAVDRYQGFNPSDVLYLIMTDRFADGNPGNDQPGYAPQAPRGWHGGDLSGIDRHIDYLQQLGVTTLWLTPVYPTATCTIPITDTPR